MRIAARDQICEILATIYEGVEYAAETDATAAIAVLDDCSAAVIAVAEELEAQLTGERAEFYLNHAAKAGEGILKMSGGIKVGGDIVQCAEDTMEALRVIYTELLDEREVKLEIAFFPYKASMWDSLESIWMAARDDERCNVTVVPIRYFDRAPDGSAAAAHCERDIFPEYVPVTRFEDYDLAAEAPDIAYIHNPYDDRNYVTSVDTAYYSRELKKHVRTLVYVPYYVSGWMSTAHMAMSACACAADVIAAFSEAEARQLKSIDPAKDTPALGSPKVDRILRFEREKPDMPPEWRDKLDGKKVFLLNTSISTLLRYGEKFCDKLNFIFDLFENRDDAALLWRPHPLSTATINSMRPGLLEGYTKLMRRILTAGVLDETADVTRAIALSDAYIGESATSLRFMYSITGKPTYFLDFSIVKNLTDAEREEILRSVCIMEPIAEPGGDTALAVSYDTNEICRIELETGRVVPLTDIPGIAPDDMYSHVYIADCGDKYILPPYSSDQFIELDRDFKLIRTVELPEQAKTDIVFSNPVRHGDYVYFLPLRSRAFARYSVKTGEYEYFYSWYKDFEKYADEIESAMFSGSYCVVGNKLYLPCYKDNIVAEMNLDTMKVKAYRFGARSNRYYSIAYDGKNFWMTKYVPLGKDNLQWNDWIVRWNIKTGKADEFSGFPKGFAPGILGFSRVVFYGEYLLAFPCLGNMILKIDPKSGKMAEYCAGAIKTAGEGLLPDPQNAVFIHAGNFGIDTIWGVMARERALLSVDTGTGEAGKVPLRFDAPHRAAERTDSKWFMPGKRDGSGCGIIYESPIFTPHTFVGDVISVKMPAKNIEQAECYLKRVANPDGSCGERVHEYVMNKFMGDGED